MIGHQVLFGSVGELTVVGWQGQLTTTSPHQKIYDVFTAHQLFGYDRMRYDGSDQCAPVAPVPSNTSKLEHCVARVPFE